MNKADRGITMPSMDMSAFRPLVNLPPTQSPFDPDHLLIESGSDISFVWNQDMFTGILWVEMFSCEQASGCTRCI